MYKNLFTRGLFSLMLCAIVGFTSQSLTAQCDHTLSMVDSYGDGWNGNSIDVLVNGTIVLDDVTLAAGTAGTEIFSADTGDDITTIWNGGGNFAYEITYTILDGAGQQIGGTGDETTNIDTGTATGFCASCTNPTATFTVTEDCAAGFSVDVDITDMGDATSIDITDGTTTLATATATGVVAVGPFTNGTPVDLTLTHDTDVLCNVTEAGLVNPTLCPTIVDATTMGSYCYGDSNLDVFEYIAMDGVSMLTIDFTAGAVENNYDALIVYDSDGTTELYNGYGATGVITGLSFTSTGSSIFWTIASDGSVNCQVGSVGGGAGIDYTVAYAVAGCGTPENVAHTLAAPVRCDITWDAVPGALRYDVHYRVTASGDAWTRSGALSNAKSLHFLAPNTGYDYIVRASCDGTWDFATATDIRRFNTGNIDLPVARDLFIQDIMNISPNPARESINVTYAVNDVSDVNISIVDMMGRTVYNKQLSNVEGQQNEAIDVSTFGQGYYMLVLQSGSDKQVQKFATIR